MTLRSLRGGGEAERGRGKGREEVSEEEAVLYGQQIIWAYTQGERREGEVWKKKRDDELDTSRGYGQDKLHHD